MSIDGVPITADTDLGLILELENVPAMADQALTDVKNKISDRQASLSSAQQSGLGINQKINNDSAFYNLVGQVENSYTTMYNDMGGVVDKIGEDAITREKEELNELISKIQEKLDELQATMDRIKAALDAIPDDDDASEEEKAGWEEDARRLKEELDQVKADYDKYAQKKEATQTALDNAGKNIKRSADGTGFTYTFASGVVTVSFDKDFNISSSSTTLETENGKVIIDTTIDPTTGAITNTTTQYGRNDLPVSMEVSTFNPKTNQYTVETTNFGADGKTPLSTLTETRDQYNRMTESTKTYYAPDGKSVLQTEERKYTPTGSDSSSGTLSVTVKDGNGNITGEREVVIKDNLAQKKIEYEYGADGKRTGRYSVTTYDYENNKQTTRKYDENGNPIGDEETTDINTPPSGKEDGDGKGDDTGKAGEDDGKGDDTGKAGEDDGKGDDTGKAGEDDGKGDDTGKAGEDDGKGDDTGKAGEDAGKGDDTGKAGEDDGKSDDTGKAGEDDGKGTPPEKPETPGETPPPQISQTDSSLIQSGADVVISENMGIRLPEGGIVSIPSGSSVQYQNGIVYITYPDGTTEQYAVNDDFIVQ